MRGRIGLLMVLLCSLSATADEISYLETLEATLALDPGVATARTDVRLGSGLLREASGAFDWRATTLFEGSFVRSALSDRGFAVETSRRDLLRQLADVTQRIADDLQAQLDSNDTSGRIPCTEAFDDNLELVLVDPNTGREIVLRCQQPEEQDDSSFEDALDALLGEDADPELKEFLQKLKDQAQEISRSQIQGVINQLNVTAIGLRQSLRLLGLAPDEFDTLELQLGTGFVIPLRNGWIITPAIAMRTTERDFVGKPRAPRFGGVGQPNEFLAAAGFEVNVPLWQGSGYRVVTAPERAARENRAASLDFLESDAERELLNSGIAYWEALAAAKSHELLVATVDLNRSLAIVASTLYDAFEIARVDVEQVNARLARAELNVLGARRSSIAARAALADAVGLRVEDSRELPEVAGDFPAVIDPERIERLDTNRLVERALASSGQIGAVMHQQQSARILKEAARLEQRRRLDLSIFTGYTGFHESLSYSDGIEGALFGKWTGPSVIMSLSFDFPFRNDIALGRYAQASALSYRAEVNAENERRLVAARIVELKNSLVDAAREVRLQEDSVRYYEQTVDDQIERLRAGEGTAIQVTIAEEQATSAKLRLVDARRVYAVLLEQLKWASGSLVERRDELLILTPFELESLIDREDS